MVDCESDLVMSVCPELIAPSHDNYLGGLGSVVLSHCVCDGSSVDVMSSAYDRVRVCGRLVRTGLASEYDE